MTTAEPRATTDRCPGLLRPHHAEDGALVRLRVPGGQLPSSILLELSRISSELAEGSVQLTSRGNLQLRGIDEVQLPQLVERVAELGLLPSQTHERVRNIVASPLTGLTRTPRSSSDLADLRSSLNLADLRSSSDLADLRSSSNLADLRSSLNLADLRSMVAELDDALCASPQLADLPGRFLFALDDGSRDVSRLGFDLAYLATGADRGLVLVGDPDHGVPTSRADAVGVLVDLATRFLRSRRRDSRAPWHVRELPAFVAEVSQEVALSPTGPTGIPLGAVGEAASVAVPLSLLHRHQITALKDAAGGGPLVVTPWRGVVVPGGASALSTLLDAGLVADEHSPWSRVTACIGSPGCAKSAISTRDLATHLVRMLSSPTDHLKTGQVTADRTTKPSILGLPVHVTGCARRCGAPADRHVDLVAPGSTAQALALIASER